MRMDMGMKYKRLTHQKYDENIDLTYEYGYSYIYKRLYELEDKIRNMIYCCESYKEGNISCSGSEAPDHLYQRCGSSLHYSIQITYKN